MSDDYIEVGGRITPVYNRFKEVGDYHPFTAETFADWSLQAGDIVTLKKNGESFEAPVYATRMTWRGATPHMELTTTGNLNRDSLTKLGERKYSSGAGGGGGGYRNSDLINTRLEQNERMIALAAWDATDADRQYSSQFTVHANKISAVTALADANGSILKQAGFELTPDGFLVYAEDMTNPNYITTRINVTAASLTSRIEDAEGNISTIVQTVSSLTSRISDTEDNVSALIQTTSSLTSRIENAEGDISTLIQTASSLTSRIESAEEDISSLVQTASSLTSRISNAEGDISTLTQTASSLTSRIEGAEGNISTLVQTVSSLTSRISDAEGNISTLTQTASSLTSRISDAEGNISTLTQTATSLTSRISDAEGNISTLTQTASSLTSRISDAEGNISVLTQTSSSLTSRISDAEGNISTLTQTATSLTSRISDTEGNVSTLTQTASSLTSRISDAEGNISTLTQTASSLTSRIESAEGDVSTLTQTASSLTSRISNAEGDISTLTQTASSLTSRIGSAEGNISTLTQTASSLTSRISDAEGNISTLTQTASTLTSQIEKTGVNNLGQNETLYSRIEQNAESITTKVSAGDIASTINQTAQSVKIQASKINLEGYVTASQLQATNASISNLTSGTTVATALKANTLQAASNFFYGNTQYDARTLKIGSVASITVLAAIPSATEKDFDHSHSVSFSVSSSGVVTTTIGKVQANNGTATFNIADTAFFKAEMASATANVKISAWKWDAANSIAYVEKGTSGGDTQGLPSMSISGVGSWNTSTYQRTYKAYAYVEGANREVASIVADATDVATAAWEVGNQYGYRSAAGVVTWPSTRTSGYASAMAISYPTTSLLTGTKRYYLTQDANWYTNDTIDVYIRPDSSTASNYVCRLEVDGSSRVTKGWNNAAATVVTPHKDSWPGGSADTQASFIYPVSGGSTATKTYTLSASAWGGDGIGDSKKCYAYMMETSDGAAARLVVDASSVYSAGNTAGQTTGWNNAVAVTKLPTAHTTASSAVWSFSIKYPTTGSGNYETKEYGIAFGGWSGGSRNIYVEPLTSDGSLTGTYIAKKSISMPSTATWNIRSETGRTYGITVKVTCTVGGKDYDGQATI